jgi:hypothetical protein
LQYQYTSKSVSFLRFYSKNGVFLNFILFYVLRSFFSSAIHQNTSTNKIDDYIKKIDFDLRRMGRISKREIEEILNEILISSELFYFFFTLRIFSHIYLFL